VVEGVEPESMTQRGPGADLRSGRERKEMSVRQVAKELRLDTRVIEALEADDFAALPAPIFVKGYLNAYCRLLGLAPDEIIARYELVAGDLAPPPLVVHRGTGDEVSVGGSRAVLIGWLIVLVSLVLVVAWWFGRPGALPEPEPEPVRTAMVVPGPAAQPVPVLVDEPGTATETGSGEEVELADATAETAPPMIPGNMRVRLEFTDDCWTEIVDAGGDRLFFDLASSGRVVEVEGRMPLVVFLGNAPAVTMMVDGEPFELGPYHRSGNIARFTLDDDSTGDMP
jgi:cytoskeleton protein RodZ